MMQIYKNFKIIKNGVINKRDGHNVINISYTIDDYFTEALFKIYYGNKEI